MNAAACSEVFNKKSEKQKKTGYYKNTKKLKSKKKSMTFLMFTKKVYKFTDNIKD